MMQTGTVRALFFVGLLLVTALTPYGRAQTSLVGAALDGTSARRSFPHRHAHIRLPAGADGGDPGNV